mmetsp:Transcript_17040/g.40148  ORF Transcript_17040/g.40148 Transcript_17040/m.40148 type:complete len:404 (-) Transcript_17040:225-1436(-)
MDLCAAVQCFGSKKSLHTIESGTGATLEVEVTEAAVVVAGGRKASKQNLNFLVLRLQFRGSNISIKLYAQPVGYFQIFGVQDQSDLTAEAVARALLGFVRLRLVAGLGGGVRFSSTLGPLSIMALSGFHPGATTFGGCFDLDEVEKLLAGKFKTSRNPRNGALVVKRGLKEGSTLFHVSGSIQVMGLRSSPGPLLAELRDLVRRAPRVIVPVVRRKRQRSTSAIAESHRQVYPRTSHSLHAAADSLEPETSKVRDGSNSWALANGMGWFLNMWRQQCQHEVMKLQAQQSRTSLASVPEAQAACDGAIGAVPNLPCPLPVPTVFHQHCAKGPRMPSHLSENGNGGNCNGCPTLDQDPVCHNRTPGPCSMRSEADADHRDQDERAGEQAAEVDEWGLLPWDQCFR